MDEEWSEVAAEADVATLLAAAGRFIAMAEDEPGAVWREIEGMEDMPVRRMLYATILKFSEMRDRGIPVLDHD